MVKYSFKLIYLDVYAACLQAATNLQFKIISENMETKEIRFRVGMSILSFGEIFTIMFTTQENSTEIEIRSETHFLQVIDWGKNNDNINSFLAEVKTILKNK